MPATSRSRLQTRNTRPASPSSGGGGSVRTSISVVGGGTPDSRLINTTAPLAGGGDLTADRTLSVATFAGAGTTGVVADPGASTGYLSHLGTWTTPAGVGPDLTAIEALATTGIAVRTAADTWALRQVVQPAAGVTVTNPAGIAGDITLALANDLAGLEALATTGFAARTAADTWAVRALTAPAAGLTISNPSGVAGNPTFALADDLAALEGLGTTGYAQRTGASTWATVAAIPQADVTGLVAALAALVPTTRTISTTAPLTGGGDLSANRTLAISDFTATTAGAVPNPGGSSGRLLQDDATWVAVGVVGPDLTAIEALATTGGAYRTAADTWALRSLTAPAAGITITNPAGVAGNPTFALADDLAALEALAGTDTIYYRSGVSTWTAVTIGSGLTFSGGTLAASGGGSGAPAGAQYVTLATDGTLSDERVLTPAGGITLTDAGAGSTVTLDAGRQHDVDTTGVVTTSTANTNTGIAFALEAGARYNFRAWGEYNTAASTTAPRFAFVASGGLTKTRFVFREGHVTGATAEQVCFSNALGTQTGGTTGITSSRPWWIEGHITVNAAGTMTLAFATEIAASTATLVWAEMELIKVQ